MGLSLVEIPPNRQHTDIVLPRIVIYRIVIITEATRNLAISLDRVSIKKRIGSLLVARTSVTDLLDVQNRNTRC